MARQFRLQLGPRAAVGVALAIVLAGCQSTEPRPSEAATNMPPSQPHPSADVAASCGQTTIYPGPQDAAPAGLAANSWASASPPKVGVTAYFWGPPPFLAVGPRPGGLSNKVLWVVAKPSGQSLRITVTPLGKNSPRVDLEIPPAAQPAGNYPSYINLPSAGCWHLEIAGVGGDVASIDFLVVD
jgi:hypothetical protein